MAKLVELVVREYNTKGSYGGGDATVSSDIEGFIGVEEVVEAAFRVVCICLVVELNVFIVLADIRWL